MDSSSPSSPSSLSSSDRYSFNPTLHWNPEVEEYFTEAYGAEHFARISKALMHPSCYSCIRVNILKSTPDAVIRKLMGILHEKELTSNTGCMNINKQSAVTEVDKVTRQGASNETTDLNLTRTTWDQEIPSENLQSPSIFKCPYPGLDYVIFVKGSGPHMLRYEGQPGQPMKEVIVSRKCAEAVLRGAQVYVPGVLACSAHVEKGDTVAVSVAVEQRGSDNGWSVGITRGIVLHGLQSDPHHHERSGLYIGRGTTLMSRAGIFRVLQGIAVEMTDRIYKLSSFYDVLEGEIFLQNLPSIVTAHVLDPQQGERILDMCAAPGGKTTAIAILMKDKGEVVAIDRSHNKVMNILKLAAEMNLTCINAYRLDALKSVCRTNETTHVGATNCANEASDRIVKNSGPIGFMSNDVATHNTSKCSFDAALLQNVSNGEANQRSYIGNSNHKDARRMRNGLGLNHSVGGRAKSSKGYMPNSFDRVLLDAPCSALGLRPRLFAGEETMESLKNHAKYQRKMFDQAVQLVRPGGILVYSTCTINPGENEAVVRYALDTYKFLSLAPQHPRIGGPGVVGHCELFGGKHVEEWLTQSEAELVQRFDPSSPPDTIGFFIAKFTVGNKDI